MATRNIINSNFYQIANANTDGDITGISVNGNIQANYYLGNGYYLTGLNIPQGYSNANVANYLPTYNGNIQLSNANITRSLIVSNVANVFIGNGSPNLFLTTNGNGSARWAKSTVDVFTNFVSAAPFTTAGGSGNGAPGFSVFDNTLAGNISNTFHVGDRIFLAGNVSDVYTITSIDAPVTYSGTFTISPNLRTAYAYGSNISVATPQPANGIIVAGQGNITYNNGQATINIFTQGGTYSNANVANYLPTYGGNIGNGAGYVFGNGYYLTGLNIPQGYSNANVANYLPTYTGNMNANYYTGNGRLLTGIINSINLVDVNTNYPQIYTIAIERSGPTNAIDVNGDPWTYTYYGWDSTTYTPTADLTAGSHTFNVTADLSSWNPGDQIAINNTGTGPYNTIQSVVYDGVSTSTVTVANPFAVTYVSPTIYYTNAYNADTIPTPAGSILIVGNAGGQQYTVVSSGGYSYLTGTYGGVTFIVNTLQGPWAVDTQVFTTRVVTHSNAFVNLLLGSNIVGNVSNNANFIGNTLYIDSIGTNYSNANVANYLPTYTGNVGNGAGYIFGNGAFLTGLPATYSNANVANYLPTYSGNISANYYTGNGTNISNTSLRFNTYTSLGISLLGSITSGTGIASVSGDQRSIITTGRQITFAGSTQVYTVTGTPTFGSGITDFSFTPVTSYTVASGTLIQTPNSLPFTQVAAGANANLSLLNNVLTIDAVTGTNVAFANTTSITYNTSANTTRFSVVDSYISNISANTASFVYRTDTLYPSSSNVNSLVGNFIGQVDESRTVWANLTLSSSLTSDSTTNGLLFANVSTTTDTGATYVFATGNPIAVFSADGKWNITQAQYTTIGGNGISGGTFNTTAGVTISAGTYRVKLAYVVNRSPSLQNVTQVNGNSNSNISFTGANVAIGNISNLHIYGGNIGQVLSTIDGTGNLTWIDNVSPGLGWRVTIAAAFDNVSGTYPGWTANTAFPVFYANGYVGTLTGINSTSYLGNPSLNWVLNAYVQNTIQFAQLYARWHNTIANTLTLSFQVVDSVGRVTLITSPLATGVNPTQSDTTIQNLFNINNPNAGPDYIDAIGYDDASGAYPFQRAVGGAVAYTENLQQVLQSGNVANLGFSLINGANITTSGNISANYFLGNGSQLTGLPGGSSLVNGNSNVVVAANGNVSISVGGVPNIAVFTSSNVFLTNSVISNTLFLTPATVTGNLNTGAVAYSNVDDTLVFYTSVNNAPIHPGREVTFTGYNQTGATLAAGSVVYITGTHGQQPQIALANAQAIATAAAVGVVQYSIPNNANGIVTTVGEVSNFNTQAYTAGQTLYLDPATPGGVTTTIPTVPNVAIRVGFVEYVNPANGKIYVSIRNAYTFANTIVGLDTYTGNIQAGNLVVTANATVQGNLRANANSYFNANVYTFGNIIANGNAYFVSNTYTSGNGTVGNIFANYFYANGDPLQTGYIGATPANVSFAILGNTSNGLTTATYANYIFSADFYQGIGNNSVGNTWTRYVPPSGGFGAASDNNGTVVFSSISANTLYYSTNNGVSWTSIPGTTSGISGGGGETMAYASISSTPIWVSPRYNGSIWYRQSSNPNGLWTRATIPALSGAGITLQIATVGYASGVFIAGTDQANGSPTILRSTDGINWTTAFTTRMRGRDVFFDGARWLMVGGGAAGTTSSTDWLAYSSDATGTSWTRLTGLPSISISYFPTGIVGSGVNGTYIVSGFNSNPSEYLRCIGNPTVAANWQLATANVSITTAQGEVAYIGNTFFLAGGSGIARSGNAVNTSWTLDSTPGLTGTINYMLPTSNTSVLALTTTEVFTTSLSSGALANYTITLPAYGSNTTANITWIPPLNANASVAAANLAAVITANRAAYTANLSNVRVANINTNYNGVIANSFIVTQVTAPSAGSLTLQVTDGANSIQDKITFTDPFLVDTYQLSIPFNSNSNAIANAIANGETLAGYFATATGNGNVLFTANVAGYRNLTSLIYANVINGTSAGVPTTLTLARNVISQGSPISVTPSAPNRAVQYNINGVFTGTNDFRYDPATATMFVDTQANVYDLNVGNITRISNVGQLYIPDGLAGQALLATGSGNLFWEDTLHYQAGVIVATTAALTATYNNGTSGVGATLTNSGTLAALVIDGVAVTSGQRVLIKDQVTQAQNGVYTVTNAGSVSVSWVLTRSTDYDQPIDILGKDIFFVTSGNVNSNGTFVQLNRVLTVGTDSLVFESSGVSTLQNVTAAGNVTTIPIAISNTSSNAFFVAGGVNLGNSGSGSNVLTISPRGVTTTSGQALYNVFSTPAQEFRFVSSNATAIYTFAYGDPTGLITAGTVGLQVRPTGAGQVRILPAVGSVVTTANVNIEVTGNGSVIVARGNTNTYSASTDEYLQIGSNTAGSTGWPVVLGINSSNTTFSGLRLSKAGAERWFIGADNSNIAGNLVINSPGGTSMVVIGATSGTQTAGTIIQSKGTGQYFANAVTVNNLTDTQVTAFNTVTDTGALTYSGSGRWTNNTGRTLQVLVTMQMAFVTNATGARIQWLRINGVVTNRRNMVDVQATTGEGTVATTSGVVIMANGDYFEWWLYQTSGSALSFGSGIAGMNSGSSAYLNYLVL